MEEAIHSSRKRYEVPIWHKTNLSIEEAVAYTGLGRDKLYQMTNKEDCPFVLWVGERRMIKRMKFDEYIAKAYSI
ncbi:excisionase [Caproicibacterium sp. BJN0003]|uniref:excisionase n=1 Tax=Caproicibacterium sp. BJN0003 TaxID=2994078 RepID=UPI00225AF099|nr:excisionase [Caproicibacterium sp. BJN0003]UZT82397.1 excisionase [Caproicibacterium sp. BJN0003]